MIRGQRLLVWSRGPFVELPFQSCYARKTSNQLLGSAVINTWDPVRCYGPRKPWAATDSYFISGKSSHICRVSNHPSCAQGAFYGWLQSTIDTLFFIVVLNFGLTHRQVPEISAYSVLLFLYIFICIASMEEDWFIHFLNRGPKCRCNKGTKVDV